LVGNPLLAVLLELMAGVGFLGVFVVCGLFDQRHGLAG
jgi:hypothetical protein